MKLNLIVVIIFSFLSCQENPQVHQNESKQSKAIPVEVLLVQQNKIDQKVELSGILKANNSIDIIAEVSGKITSKNKFLGDYVTTKSILAVIDDVILKSQYDQAKAQLITAKNNLDIALKTFKSDSILYINKDISELEFANSKANYNSAKAQFLSANASLNAAKKSFDDTRIKSPINGIISRDNIELGTMVTTGMTVYRVVDINNLRLNVYVPQENINLIKVGSKARVSVSPLNGKYFNGTIKRISPQADESTGGFLVEIQVPNKERIIKAGMTAKAEIFINTEKNLIAIPEYAVTTKQGKYFVYKVNNGFAELTEVTISKNFGDKFIIEKGLAINDTIVTVGMKNLGIKTKVKIEN